MTVIDLRDELERADWSIGTSRKISATVHWPAASVRITDPLGALHGYAAYHVSKDWAPEAGIQGGDGIQYARAVDQGGTRYLLRDLGTVLWHCDSAYGNATSVPYLALVAKDEAPTPALLRGLRTQIEEDRLLAEVHPHGPTWTNTACPGDGLRDWIAAGLPTHEEDDMTPEQDTRLKNVEAKLDDLINQQTALADNLPRVWLQRLFYGLNPYRGKRRGVSEIVPAELVVPD